MFFLKLSGMVHSSPFLSVKTVFLSVCSIDGSTAAWTYISTISSTVYLLYSVSWCSAITEDQLICTAVFQAVVAGCRFFGWQRHFGFISAERSMLRGATSSCCVGCIRSHYRDVVSVKPLNARQSWRLDIWRRIGAAG